MYKCASITSATLKQRWIRIGWDLGIRSPSGYSNRINDIELGYSMYVDDIIETKCEETFIEMVRNVMKK